MLIDKDTDLKSFFAKDGMLKALTKNLFERALKAEMDEHLGYSKYGRRETENSRNGVGKKSLITEGGVLELEVPRDRNAEFSPMLVPKRQSRIDGLDQKILSLYAKGMSVSDIKMQIQELYGAEISESLISRVTDNIMDEVRSWQHRPLEGIYAIVYFDALIVKVRQDKRIINKAVYVALGIDLTGRKDILGLWISENEGAKFWLNNFTEMKNRGLKEGIQFATLTDIITKAWSDKSTKEYKVFKGLKKENLRDNMTNTELILNMLAEASTKDISQATNPNDFEESKKVAKQGGNVAKVALKELESKTGKKVVSPLNAKSVLGIDKPKKKKEE